MPGFSDLAASMLVSAQKRLDATAINVSNVATPGFRSSKVFQQVLDARQGLPVVATIRPRAKASAALKATGNPLDIAVTGGGSLLLRDGDQLLPVTSVQLQRDRDGRLVDTAGRSLQASGGGDLVVSSDSPQWLKDGTVLVGGQPEARAGVFALEASGVAGGLSAAAGAWPDAAEDAVVHQGMVAPSDVDLGTEMIEITRAARAAETGARVFQIYDDLIGRVATKTGEAMR